MARIKFREIRLSNSNKDRLDIINQIITEYQEEGYKLTLRQLYYQLVSRDVIPNKQTEYTKLSNILKEGRMGGIVDWDAIEDRLRIPSVPASWNDPQEAMESLIEQFMLPRMNGQPNYIEVWVEKDALSGVLKRVTEKYHIPILVNRGYSSVSAMFDAYQRFRYGIKQILEYGHDGSEVIILYLGDFDPSGIDMIRDIKDRILEFSTKHYDYFPLSVIPVALTREQIIKYKPPKNPAKISDPRAKEFISKHGSASWEVDALPPNILNLLLESAIKKHVDLDLYKSIVSKEKNDIERLENAKYNL